jgi:hypothetical protein
MQAKIVEQLHNATKTDAPWISGKTLLKNAGSNVDRISNLFRRHNNWRSIIKSDNKGNYCLKFLALFINFALNLSEILRTFPVNSI